MPNFSIKQLFAAALLCGAQTMAQAGPVNFLYEACPPCAPKDLAYSQGEFDQVHWVAAEAGAQNRQALAIAAPWLAKLLQSVQIKQANGKLAAWLDEESALSMANGIAAAIEKAQTNQDAIFLMTNRVSSGFVTGKLANSGRAFVDAEGLQIIVGEAHVEFFGAYRATRMLRKFDFGSRNKASAVVLQSPHLRAGRSDWLQIPLQTIQQSTQMNPASNSGLYAPVAPVAPLPATATVPAPSAKPVVRDQNYFDAQELRLKNLKRLREQGLLSEEEFQAKRREILRDL